MRGGTGREIEIGRGGAAGSQERREGGTREDLMNGMRGMKGIETGSEETRIDEKLFLPPSAEVDPPHVALFRIKVEAWYPMRMTQRVKGGRKDTGPE